MNAVLEKMIYEYVNSRNIRQLEVEFLIQDQELDLVNKMKTLTFKKTECFDLLDEMVKHSRQLIDSLSHTRSLKDGVRHTYDIIELDTTGSTKGQIIHRDVSFKDVIEKLQEIHQTDEYGLDINKYAINLRDSVVEDIVKKHRLSIPEFVNLFDLQGIVRFSDDAMLRLATLDRDIKKAFEVIEKDKEELTRKVEQAELMMNTRSELLDRINKTNEF